MAKSRTKNSIINISAGLGSQVVITILQFFSRTVFIHTLGTSYLGINGLFSNILTMLSLTELGLDTAINFKLYKPLADGDIKRLQVLMKFYREAYFIVGTVILVLGSALIPFLPTLIKDYGTLDTIGINPILIYLLYLLQSAVSYLFFASKSAIIKADQKLYITTGVNSLISILLIAVQIITLKIYSNFILYTALGLIATVVTNFISARIAVKKYPAVFKPTKDRLDASEVRDIFKDLGALFVYRVNNVVIKATDNIVLSAFVGLVTVGLYSNYLMFYTTINTILDKVYSAVKASMGNLFATESIERKYRFFQIMNYISIIIYGAAGVGVAICADELINVWIGMKFVIEKPFAVLIGIEILFHGLKANLGQIRNVSGAFRQMWFRPMLGVIVNLGVSVWLVNIYGIYGVIIGTITADILTNFLVDPFIIHKYSFQNYRPVREYYTKNFAYLSVLALVYFLDSFLCQLFCVNAGWFSLIVHIMICGISVPLVFVTLFHKSHENTYVLHLVKNIVLENNILQKGFS